MWWMWLVTAFAADTWARVAPESPLFAHAGDAAPVTTVLGREDYLFAVVSQRDGWVELRNSRPKVRPCESGQLAPDDAALTLWTPAASLLPVATRVVHVAPEAGVTLDVWPGWVAGGDPFDAWAKSKLPKDLFGTTFVIPEGTVENEGGVFARDWDGQLRIGGGVLTLHSWRVDSAELKPPVKVWMDGRCLAVVAPTVTEIPFPMLGSLGMGFGLGGSGEGFFGALGLRAGASLRWPDGTEAGKVVDELLVYDPASAGGLTCGTWRLWGPTTPAGARVCVSTADLGRVAFGTTDPDAAIVWGSPGAFSSVPRSVMADALVALEPAVAACLSDVAPRSAFEVTFTLKDGAVASAAVKSVPPEGPVPACLAPVMQKIVLPPKSSGRPSVGLRWNG